MRLGSAPDLAGPVRITDPPLTTAIPMADSDDSRGPTFGMGESAQIEMEMDIVQRVLQLIPPEQITAVVPDSELQNMLQNDRVKDILNSFPCLTDEPTSDSSNYSSPLHDSGDVSPYVYNMLADDEPTSDSGNYSSSQYDVPPCLYNALSDDQEPTFDLDFGIFGLTDYSNDPLLHGPLSDSFMLSSDPEDYLMPGLRVHKEEHEEDDQLEPPAVEEDRGSQSDMQCVPMLKIKSEPIEDEDDQSMYCTPMLKIKSEPVEDVPKPSRKGRVERQYFDSPRRVRSGKFMNRHVKVEIKREVFSDSEEAYEVRPKGPYQLLDEHSYHNSKLNFMEGPSDTVTPKRVNTATIRLAQMGSRAVNVQSENVPPLPPRVYKTHQMSVRGKRRGRTPASVPSFVSATPAKRGRKPANSSSLDREGHNEMERYRRKAQRLALIALSHQIPSLAKDSRPPKVKILEESARYILQLQQNTLASEEQSKALNARNKQLHRRLKSLINSMARHHRQTVHACGL